MLGFLADSVLCMYILPTSEQASLKKFYEIFTEVLEISGVVTIVNSGCFSRSLRSLLPSRTFDADESWEMSVMIADL